NRLDSRLRGNDGVSGCCFGLLFRVAVFGLLFLGCCFWVAVFGLLFYRNDEILDCKNLSPPPSFPRKWESRNKKQQEFIGNN
ncbi:hypothetical protein, partial [Neisseria gonorrhoeae]|uniref:hypothetical protein n=1 Tax=Neisseria gonorrhoeae TaxID=485 RepID=UPI001C405A57